MFEELTQQQRWGFAFAASQLNAYNTSRQDPELRTDWTAQEVAAARLSTIGDSLWLDLLNYKNDQMRAAFLNAPPELQSQVQAILGVEDVL